MIPSAIFPCILSKTEIREGKRLGIFSKVDIKTPDMPHAAGGVR